MLTRFTASTLSLAAGAFALPAAAQEPSLEGETVEYVIPLSESGGSAQRANFYAPLLSEALPCNPDGVVRYRPPGAASPAGANGFAEQDTTDGTLLFGTSGSTQLPYLLDDPRVRYDNNVWQVVPASGTGGMVYPAFGEIKVREDFAEISEETLGIYPQAIGADAQAANQEATSVTAKATQYVLDWLEESYGVTME